MRTRTRTCERLRERSSNTEGTTNTNRHAHTPGRTQCIVKAGLLACRHPSRVLPSRARGTVAFDEGRQAYSSGGCAGLACDGFAHVTGFPFHLPADEQDGTIHLIGRDSTARVRHCHRILWPLA
jgi:hypothetical protein